MIISEKIVNAHIKPFNKTTPRTFQRVRYNLYDLITFFFGFSDNCFIRAVLPDPVLPTTMRLAKSMPSSKESCPSKKASFCVGSLKPSGWPDSSDEVSSSDEAFSSSSFSGFSSSSFSEAVSAVQAGARRAWHCI